MQEYTKVPAARLFMTIIITSFAITAIAGKLGLPRVCRKGEKLARRVLKFKNKVQKMKK